MLGYKNGSKTFSISVAVQLIRENLRCQFWMDVESKSKPAADTSHSLSSSNQNKMILDK